VVFTVEKQRSVSPRESWVKAAFADTGSAIDAWIHSASVKPDPKQKQRIIDKSLHRTHTIQLAPEASKRLLREETYEDILESSLSEYFSPGVRLDNLPGISQNQVRITNLYNPQQHDEIDLLLRLALMNFEIYLAYVAGEADLTSSLDVDILLRAKADRLLKRIHRAKGVSEGFSKILRINRMVDINVAVAAGELGFGDIAKIRGSSGGQDFRKWFHKSVADSPEEACREYVAAISRPNLTDKLPVKTIRFLLTFLGSIPGVVGLILGPTISFMDNFLLGKWLRGYSPKFLIDELRTRLPASNAVK